MFRILLCLGLIALVFGQAWQSKVDDNLIQEGLSQAAILDLGGSVFAISTGFNVSTIISSDVVKLLVRLFHS